MICFDFWYHTSMDVNARAGSTGIIDFVRVISYPRQTALVWVTWLRAVVLCVSFCLGFDNSLISLSNRALCMLQCVLRKMASLKTLNAYQCIVGCGHLIAFSVE
jgi:hypothetical protein